MWLLTLAPFVVALLPLLAPLPVAAQDPAPALSPEEQLAQKYAPIAYVKRQDFPCDPGGESYLPAPVDLVFGDPAVTLRQFPGREETKRNLAPGDLAAGSPDTGADAYVDLPGDPREPACSYERHAKERTEALGAGPVVYAHVATETVDGEPGLALQYWF